MRHIGLFEGIGGFSLAACWMGWETVAWCEWDAFCQRVLKYHFPEAEQHGDITTTDFTRYAGQVDILTGGFPCQPYSSAGKRLGKEDDRHLWPEMLRAIREIQPRWVVGENVRGLTNWNGGLVFDEVQADLENEGYEVTPYLLPACAVNAPHRRDRIWFVAKNSNKIRRDSFKPKSQSCEREQWEFSAGNNVWISDASNANGIRQDASQREYEKQPGEGRQYAQYDFEPDGNAPNPGEMRREDGIYGQQSGRQAGERGNIHKKSDWQHFPTQPPVCSRNDGIPNRLDGITFPKWREKSIGAYGNAIVPQVALQIFKSIQAYEQ